MVRLMETNPNPNNEPETIIPALTPINVWPVEMMTPEQWEMTFQLVQPTVDAYRADPSEENGHAMFMAMLMAGVTEWDAMSFLGKELE